MLIPYGLVNPGCPRVLCFSSKHLVCPRSPLSLVFFHIPNISLYKRESFWFHLLPQWFKNYYKLFSLKKNLPSSWGWVSLNHFSSTQPVSFGFYLSYWINIIFLVIPLVLCSPRSKTFIGSICGVPSHPNRKSLGSISFFWLTIS